MTSRVLVSVTPAVRNSAVSQPSMIAAYPRNDGQSRPDRFRGRGFPVVIRICFFPLQEFPADAGWMSETSH